MPLPIVLKSDEINADGTLKKIVGVAMSSPTTLDAAPTTAGNQLPRHGDWGFYSTKLYLNLGGTVYRFDGTAV